MSLLPTTNRVHGSGARLRTAIGSLPAGVDLDIVVDQSSMTLTGGDPVTAWQLPHNALIGGRVQQVGLFLEVTGWVSGTHFLLTIPMAGLSQGTPDEIKTLFGFLGTTVTSRTTNELTGVDSSGTSRRSLWMVMSAIVIVGLVLAIVLAIVLQSSPSTTSSWTTTQEHAMAAAMNLTIHDFPSTWAEDNPSTAPLSGLLGTAPSSKETAQEKKAYNEIVGEYKQCMGLSNAQDRMFGAAGVAPAVQVPSAPYGTVVTGNLIEAGSVTQYYPSTQNVQADLVQMKLPPFSRCFAQTMTRFTVAGSNPAEIKTIPPTVVTPPRTQLGVYITGAVATEQLPTTTGTTAIEIGAMQIVYGHYEQTLYTFSSPGTFPYAERQQLTSTLAARLAGVNSTSNA